MVIIIESVDIAEMKPLTAEVVRCRECGDMTYKGFAALLHDGRTICETCYKEPLLLTPWPQSITFNEDITYAQESEPSEP